MSTEPWMKCAYDEICAAICQRSNVPIRTDESDVFIIARHYAVHRQAVKADVETVALLEAALVSLKMYDIGMSLINKSTPAALSGLYDSKEEEFANALITRIETHLTTLK